ncbi:MAG: UvrB/UvrC motif-containing protein, partial [Anaerolineales bacterium]|nr:UvrB/UvrC motif-containing protein [Anaerolineales bacterium]
NLRISKEEYRKDIQRLKLFLEGNRKQLFAEMRADMQAASKELKFEKAARLRDEIEMLETLRDRGEIGKHEQPEVFYIDPNKDKSVLEKQPRTLN